MKELPDYFGPLVDLLTAYIEQKPNHFTLQTYVDGIYQGPYVQALQEDGNILLIEAVSNEYLQPPLDESGHQVLLFMGWRFFPEGYLPNYTQFINQADVNPREIALKLARALHFAYGVDQSYSFEIGPQLAGLEGHYQQLGVMNE
ncbi:hypothetical protein MCEMRE196_00474 [Candidatus Nanopelagicaceae bacterium]